MNDDYYDYHDKCLYDAKGECIKHKCELRDAEIVLLEKKYYKAYIEINKLRDEIDTLRKQLSPKNS